MLRDAATKTANERTLALDAATVALVEQLRAEREQFGPWMFGVGDELVNPDRIGYWWRQARNKAGIDQRWRLHDLRHWSATVAIAEGHNVRTVAGRLGHADPAMTLRGYAHAGVSRPGCRGGARRRTRRRWLTTLPCYPDAGTRREPLQDGAR